jgi:repressor LexA
MHLYSPTIREIAREFSFRSPQGVIAHLDALERKGWIRRVPNQVRGIEVLRGN